MKKSRVFRGIMVCFFLLAGCGQSENFTSFQEGIDRFYTEVTSLEQSIEEMDAGREDAVSTLLIYMEQMLEEYEKLAEMEIPVEFSNIEGLADDAAEYMSNAVQLYKKAYEEETVNDAYVQAAAESYASAVKRIDYIGTLLQGEIPEGAVVIESDGNEFEPYGQEESE